MRKPHINVSTRYLPAGLYSDLVLLRSACARNSQKKTMTSNNQPAWHIVMNHRSTMASPPIIVCILWETDGLLPSWRLNPRCHLHITTVLVTDAWHPKPVTVTLSFHLISRICFASNRIFRRPTAQYLTNWKQLNPLSLITGAVTSTSNVSAQITNTLTAHCFVTRRRETLVVQHLRISASFLVGCLETMEF